MYSQQHNWLTKLKNKFPQYFMENKKILEVGSFNVNGTFREHFAGEYTGIDISDGMGVDIISLGHEYDVPDWTYDVVFSTNSLEHDIYWRKTLINMIRVLKPDGLFFIICSGKWAEHGTKEHEPYNSLTSRRKDTWSNYYHSITPQELMSGLNVYKNFETGNWRLEMFRSIDLTFWGIKHQI